MFIFILLLAGISCEEDFNMNAPYKDITVVFGMMDRGQDTTWLRINKAFLGEGNTLEMVKVEDSSIYRTSLQVFVDEFDGSSLLRTITFDSMTIDNKQDGLFYNPYQLLYFAPFTVNQDYKYNLRILLNNKEVTASTGVVNNFTISKPNAGSTFIQIRYDTDNEIEWTSAKNGKRYEVVLRFNFKELWEGSPDTVFRYIDWQIGTQKSDDTEGGRDMFASYRGEAFYAWLSDQVPYADLSKEAQVQSRFTGNIDFIFSVAAAELNTYMEVNEPSNSIIQERPDYTNISNGIGIFSSRYRNIRSKKPGLDPTVVNIKNLNLKFEY